MTLKRYSVWCYFLLFICPVGLLGLVAEGFYQLATNGDPYLHTPLLSLVLVSMMFLGVYTVRHLPTRITWNDDTITFHYGLWRNSTERWDEISAYGVLADADTQFVMLFRDATASHQFNPRLYHPNQWRTFQVVLKDNYPERYVHGKLGQLVFA